MGMDGIMISGKDPLTSIERELAGERDAVTGLAKRLDDGSARQLTIGKEQLAAYRELARLRLKALTAATAGAATLPASLDATERQVAAILRAREEAADALQRDIRAAEAERARLEGERATAAKRQARAAAEVDAAEADTQARLEDDPGYRDALEAAHDAERVAMHAEEKATSSEQELDAKGQAYRDDPLFMYLWRRHFGTPAYRAAPLYRWLDGKVAHHARYLAASHDYGTLLEIPKRLREHATGCRTRADAAFARVHDLDRKAREADGIPALEAAEAEVAAAVQAIDAGLETQAARNQALVERQRRMAAGEDDAYQQAVELLATALEGDALQELHQQAMATPFPDDDVVIARLEGLERERRQIATAADELKAAVEKRQQRVKELESLRNEFKRRQYDQPGQGFEDGALVATVLANVLGGMLRRDALWRVLDLQRRPDLQRSDPTFGSGGFGRGTPWGGGFRTGGSGRPGGGFRTGGRF